MTVTTIKLTREQAQLARIIVEADRRAGRDTDPLLARIAAVGDEPLTVEAPQVSDTATHLTPRASAK